MTAIYLMLLLNSFLFFVIMNAARRITDTQEIVLKQLRDAPPVVLDWKVDDD